MPKFELAEVDTVTIDAVPLLTDGTTLLGGSAPLVVQLSRATHKALNMGLGSTIDVVCVHVEGAEPGLAPFP